MKGFTFTLKNQEKLSNLEGEGFLDKKGEGLKDVEILSKDPLRIKYTFTEPNQILKQHIVYRLSMMQVYHQDYYLEVEE